MEDETYCPKLFFRDGVFYKAILSIDIFFYPFIGLIIIWLLPTLRSATVPLEKSQAVKFDIGWVSIDTEIG